jgi:hypothetical protein
MRERAAWYSKSRILLITLKSRVEYACTPSFHCKKASSSTVIIQFEGVNCIARTDHVDVASATTRIEGLGVIPGLAI